MGEEVPAYDARNHDETSDDIFRLQNTKLPLFGADGFLVGFLFRGAFLFCHVRYLDALVIA